MLLLLSLLGVCQGKVILHAGPCQGKSQAKGRSLDVVQNLISGNVRVPKDIIGGQVNALETGILGKAKKLFQAHRPAAQRLIERKGIETETDGQFFRTCTIISCRICRSDCGQIGLAPIE